MNKSKLKSEGGLVLKTHEIKTILNEPDSVGIAFGVLQVGQAANVDLKVYKVLELGGNLMGQERAVVYKKGAQAVDQFASDINRFKFQFLNELMQCQFGFSYMKKSIFLDLFVDNEEELFIAGSLREYGNTSQINGEWFTLSISARKNPKSESLTLLGNPPKVVQLEGCPPVWTVTPIAIEGQKENYQLSFKKSTTFVIPTD